MQQYRHPIGHGDGVRGSNSRNKTNAAPCHKTEARSKTKGYCITEGARETTCRPMNDVLCSSHLFIRCVSILDENPRGISESHTLPWFLTYWMKMGNGWESFVDQFYIQTFGLLLMGSILLLLNIMIELHKLGMKFSNSGVFTVIIMINIMHQNSSSIIKGNYKK